MWPFLVPVRAGLVSNQGGQSRQVVLWIDTEKALLSYLWETTKASIAVDRTKNAYTLWTSMQF